MIRQERGIPMVIVCIMLEKQEKNVAEPERNSEETAKASCDMELSR